MILGTEHGLSRSAIVPPSLHLDMVAGDGHRYLFDPRPRAPDGDGCVELCASLDGLLVLEQRRHCPYYGTCNASTYIICNPVTRQWTNLPALCPATVATGSRFFASVYGFYFHASSDEYRLLFGCVTPPSEEEPYFCIVSVGRTLPRRLMSCGPVLDEDDRKCAVLCHGALHWLSRHRPLQSDTGSKGEIMAFDTVSEAFRLISLPPVLGRTRVWMDLLELDGELSFAIMPNYVTLDIWALQDYDDEAAENGRWTLRHRMNVQPPPPPLSDNLGLPMMSLSVGSSAILIGFPISEARLYSLKENDHGVHREIIFRGCPTFMVFSESLVHHAFFDLPRCPEIVPLNFTNVLFNEDDMGTT
ncbi:hypothetical protein HU200_026437 [Digitaria exilis]|uniref:F-box associated beta-propeller type 3 domain-containing protein n=1 Tax=Digitaria exilis TaxID=1010633 RepID=A0A835C330_9POAL|nr:hypothetical protein HU200_026437 [Digitaria exilis]